MESPISASLGAMGPLLRKLDMLLLEPSEGLFRLHKGAKLWMHLLKDDLEEITSYLRDLSEVEDPPLTAKCWMKEVRELSYDIENYIDSFVLPSHVANIKTRSGRRRRQCRIRVRHIKITRLLETSKKLNRRKRVAARISDFRKDAREALERHKRYQLHYCCTSIRRGLLPAAGRLPMTWGEGAGIIIDDRMRKFVDSMADDRDPQLKVVSVVGSEGIGKTTLVKVLYHKLKGQFDCRAFIRLTRKPDIKTVLRDILTQLQQQQPHNHCEDSDLLGKIREHLQYKRYLIIIDDLWSASIWDVISYAFPGGKMCSRIITSTQIEDVALACCYYHLEYVFKMRPLDEDLSRELFFNSFFCPENDFPQQLKDVLNKIVKICGGLPLATTIIARLLATHPVILMEQWTYIYDSLSSKLRTSSSASEGMKLVVNFSYNNLTCHLKMCLLYLSMYPEGCTVCKDDLVKQWVAEGFIYGTEGREVETAESYFHELIGRRFLQPECIKYTGEVVSCSVHEVVCDLIAQKSLEENFVMVLDRYRRNVSLSENVHRLSLHFPYTKYAMTNIRSSQVRSLTYFGLSKCMPSIREFKLLRVLNLNLSGHDDDDDDIIDLTGISDLLRLRYLKVASDVCIELPKHMGGLRYLETLDISKKVTYVASDIIHLPCLLHLHLPLETNLMDWLDMTGPAASVWSFGKLSNLRYLYLTYSIPVPDHLQRNMEALGSLFRGHGSLKTLAFILSSVHKNAVAHSPSEATVTWDWDDFAPLLLERFEWLLHSCSFSRVPKWIGELGNLCILKISVKELMRDGVNILGELPALTTLSLYVKIAPVKRIIFDKAGFSVLKYFKFMCSTIPWLKFEADAMPNLQKLKLGFSAHSHRVDQQSTVPISIEHLPGLKQISAKVADASSDVESALMAAVSNHPRNPRIRMQLVDWNSYGHGVWYTVSKQENPLDLEDKIPDPEEGLYDNHCVPQYKDSMDDQNKEAYVRDMPSNGLPIKMHFQLQLHGTLIYDSFCVAGAFHLPWRHSFQSGKASIGSAASQPESPAQFAVVSLRMGYGPPAPSTVLAGIRSGELFKVDSGHATSTSTVTEADTKFETRLEDVPQAALEPGRSTDQETSRVPGRVLRRLAQNRDAARKSRLRKKAYIQQLETHRMKLAQLEMELQRARQQGAYANGNVGDSALGYTGSIDPGVTAFEIEYSHWVDEQKRHSAELMSALQGQQTSELELRLLVETGLSNYEHLFRIKAMAANADVFHVMSGMWKTPAERFFLWIGGFRPSEVLKIMSPQLEPLTEPQRMLMGDAQHASAQAEDALSQGLEQLQQNLADAETLTAATAVDRLKELVGFVTQADHLRMTMLQQMHKILTTRQAARGLLALGDYFQRLRTLSSLWAARPREAEGAQGELMSALQGQQTSELELRLHAADGHRGGQAERARWLRYPGRPSPADDAATDAQDPDDATGGQGQQTSELELRSDGHRGGQAERARWPRYPGRTSPADDTAADAQDPDDATGGQGPSWRLATTASASAS